MKRYIVAVAASLSLSACIASPAPTAAPSTTPAPTVAVTSTPISSTRPAAYRVIPTLAGFARVSPDGRWIVTQGNRDPSSVQLFTIDGVLTREFSDAGRFVGWLPDSTGVFVALEIPQRAAPLTIVELDGRIVRTELQLSHETLSRDGALIVAQQQEGCCVSVTQREIRVARRDGTGTRTLVTSQTTEVSHPIELLGVDASNRAVYRDGTKIMRVALAGDASTTLATAPEYAGAIQGTTSPDGTAMFARIPRGLGPERWYLIANDRVNEWDGSLDLIVENSSGPAKGHLTPLWIGTHAFVAQDGSGSIFMVDALTLARTPLTGRLLTGDSVLAYQNDTLLVVRGDIFVLMNVRTGVVRDTGLDLRPFGGPGFTLGTLPTGGFVLSNDKATYRID